MIKLNHPTLSISSFCRDHAGTPNFREGAFLPRDLERAQAMADRINKICAFHNSLILVEATSDVEEIRMKRVYFAHPERPEVIAESGDWVEWHPDVAVFKGDGYVRSRFYNGLRRFGLGLQELTEPGRPLGMCRKLLQAVRVENPLSVCRSTEWPVAYAARAPLFGPLRNLAELIERASQQKVYVFPNHIEFFTGPYHRTIRRGEWFIPRTLTVTRDEHVRTRPEDFDRILREGSGLKESFLVTPDKLEKLFAASIPVPKLVVEELTIEQLADATIKGVFGEGDKRVEQLGDFYPEVQKEVNRRENEEALVRLKQKLLREEEEHQDNILQDVAKQLALRVSDHVGMTGTEDGVNNVTYSFETEDVARSNMVTIKVTVSPSHD